MTGILERPIVQGGVIAAGAGRRLRTDGRRDSKPMVRVAGRPLIDHALSRFRAVGIRRLTVIINETSDDCRQWLNSQLHDLDIEVIVRTTPSSYASFQLVAERLAPEPAVITTVDGIMSTDDFRDFVKGAGRFPREAVVLGLTDHVNDDGPFWATLEPTDGRIRRLGGDGGSHVTAGLYVLPAERPAAPTGTFGRLREYLGWLVSEGHPVYGIVLPHVFDIDRVRDIAAAEECISRREPRDGGA